MCQFDPSLWLGAVFRGCRTTSRATLTSSLRAASGRGARHAVSLAFSALGLAPLPGCLASLGLCLRGLSVAQGSPPPPVLSPVPPRGPSKPLNGSPVALGPGYNLVEAPSFDNRRQRGLSVAQGSPPISFGPRLACVKESAREGLRRDSRSWTAYFQKLFCCCFYTVPLMRSLGLCIFLSLLRALRRPLPAKGSPLGRLSCAMLAGTDYRCLYSLGVIASPGCEPVLSWSRHSASGKSLGRRRGHEVRSGIFSRASAVLLGVWLGGTQPLCVWAAPKGLPALLAVTEAIAARVPEHLPDGGDAGSDSRGHIGSVDRATDEPWSVLVARMQEQALLEAYGEHLDPPSLRFLFLKPGFPDEVVPLRDLPEDPAAALRDAASGLDVGLYDQPMIPVEAEAQPWPGIMTALQVPCWVPISTTAIIILDLTAVGGPLFSSFVPALLTFRDLADFASAYTQLEWEVYQPSDVIPLISSFSQLVTSGQVFRYVYPGHPPRWHNDLPLSFARVKHGLGLSLSYLRS